MATYGYGRVSRDSQTSENQKLAIEQKLGMPVDAWYEDHAISGSTHTTNRPNFSKMVRDAVAGDTLVFSRVDRISRKASDTLTAVEELLARGVEVFILQIGTDPLSSAKGKMILGIFAVFAENERMSIIERTKAGLDRTKKEGTVLGPKLKIHPAILKEMCEGRARRVTLDALSAEFGHDRNTILRNVKKWADKMEEYEAEWDKRELQYGKS